MYSHRPFTTTKQIFERLLRIGLALAIALVAALPAQLAFVAPIASAAPAAPAALTMTISSSAASINAGDEVSFKTTLENTSGANEPNILLSLKLSGPVDGVQARLLKDQSSDYRTDGLRREDDTIHWKGGLKAGGKLVIGVRVNSFTVEIEGVNAGQLKLAGEAGPVDGAPIVDASETVTVQYPPMVDHADVVLKKVMHYPHCNGALCAAAASNEVLSRQEVGIELQMTNNSANTIYSLLVDKMEMAEVGAAAMEMVENACKFDIDSANVTAGRGFQVPIKALGTGEEGYAFLVKTEPGKTSKTLVRGHVFGTPNCTLQGKARAHMTAVAPGSAAAFEADAAAPDTVNADEIAAPKLAFVQRLAQLEPKWTALVTLLILLSEFGDAPDSSNHFPGATMNAYFAPNVAGNFPTVFDLSTGTPPGPKHKNGRPLHLGTLVSPELGVDVGPGRNLIPPTDVSDLDRHDDGVDPSMLTLQHCWPTTIPFEVTMNQLAVDTFTNGGTHAYLNIWLDGNHDGNWDDVLECDNDLFAPEHIVIDQPIFPGAGVGTFSLLASTGNLPIPLGEEDKEMWLRVTISDEPSVKTDSVISLSQIIEYGDGRGPDTGYRWGETEDYLHVPQAVAAAPGGRGFDWDLVAEPTVQVGIQADAAHSAGVGAVRRNQVILRTSMRNLGDRLAKDTRLVVELDPYLGLPEIEDVYGWTGCLTCTVASRVAPLTAVEPASVAVRSAFEEVCVNGNDCHLELALGDVPPGKVTDVLLGWSWGEASDRVNFDVKIANNGSSKQRQITAYRLTRPPTITSPRPGTLGWMGCLTCTGIFKGSAAPNVEVNLFSESFATGNLTTLADEQGFWQIDVPLTDGINEVQAWTGCLTCTVAAQSVNTIPDGSLVSDPLVLNVDSSLDWDPTSFGMKVLDSSTALRAAESDDSCGPWQFIDDAGRSDLNGWKIPIWPQQEYELTLRSLCNNENITLQWEGLSTPKVFSDDDGDDYFTLKLDGAEIGSSGQDGVDAKLTITCDGNEAVYNGKIVPVKPATVFDGSNGQVVDGADFNVWQFNIGMPPSARLALWEAQAFGQTNPQTTDENGQFSFLAPAGAYGLTALIDGFQPFRAGPFRMQGAFPARPIALTPVQSGVKTARVRITEDGFDPPVLRVEPGTVVEWMNGELGIAQVETAIPATVAASADAAAMNWDSGQLAAGERYRLTFTGEGEYTYIDSENPASQATIQVVPPEPERDGSIFLPLVTR